MSEMTGTHIQIPRLILKNFHNEKNELFYYDFDSDEIGRGRAKTFYCEEGYYSNDVEKYLGSKVESPLGQLVKFLKTASFIKGEEPPKQYEDTAFKYIYSLVSRAPSLLKEMQLSSSFFEIFSEVKQHDIAARDGLVLAKEKHLLQGYRVAFLINNTDEEFVLPTGGVVQHKKFLICPVSPKRAIVFDDRKNTNLCEGEIALFEINDEYEIKDINVQSFRQEENGDKKYIVATNKNILKRILLMCKEKSV